jgi:uncharacterized membrane protein
MQNSGSFNEPLQRRWLLLSVLGLSSALSTVLSAFRIWYSDAFVYLFLNWNLLLAWVPLGLALLLWRLDRRSRRPKLIMLAVFAGWFLFFPNSPYIVSDLIHLSPRNNVPLWFDTIMIFSFAWNGLILGFLSLWLVQQLMTGWLGRAASWLLVAGTLGATGFGIYLGRFQRWNSWDILVDPIGLLRDVAIQIANPFDYPRTLGVTILFAGFLMVAYLTLTLLPAALRSERIKN